MKNAKQGRVKEPVNTLPVLSAPSSSSAQPEDKGVLERGYDKYLRGRQSACTANGMIGAQPLPPPTQMYYSGDMYGTGVVPQTGMMYPPYVQFPYQQQPMYPVPQQEIVPIQEEEPIKKKDELPIHGNQSNYNINSLLFNNIMESEYFKALYQLGTYHEVIGNSYTY